MNIRPHNSNRRGVAVVQVAVASALLLSCAALAVDVGYMTWARAQIQRTVDSSALAGASGVVTGDAEPRAVQFAAANNVVGSGLVPDELDIATGNWDATTRSFTATPESGVGGVWPNACRVGGTRGELGLFFSRIMGFTKTQVSRPATAMAGAGQCAGIWGLDGVTINGDAVTDSYVTTAGSYGPGNMRQNGDVCSCKDIVTHGGITIKGDAMYGEGYEFDPSGTSYEVTGLIADHACDVPDISPDYDYYEDNNDNADIPLASNGKDVWKGFGHFFLTGTNHVTLPPGEFWMHDMRIEGQAYIEITGPTTLYIQGNAFMGGGGIINVTENPHNLIIYAQGPQITLTGTSTFYGALVAPTATLDLPGDFEAYGVVLAQVLECHGNLNFHVEEQMVFDMFGLHSIRPILVE
jgi:putative Tad-like protein involved in Flp pilus assembly